jgi:ribosomal protein S12 methylthiotransferase accessory factor
VNVQRRILELSEKYPFFSLAQAGSVVGGLVGSHTIDTGGPVFNLRIGMLGNLTGAFPQILDMFGNEVVNGSLVGGGTDELEELALVRAVAEAAERYANCGFSADKIEIATANELGENGLAFADFLRCSPQEYAHPRCTLRPFNPDTPIRWVNGYSLLSKKPVLVPLALSHFYVTPWEEERFCHGISTGVASHTDPLQAIVSGINEVVERDALTLTWLLRLPLPRIVFDEDPPKELMVKFSRLQRSRLRQYFFNATTDIGVPTVYSVQLTERHKRVSQFVGCSSGLSLWDNCAKIIRECAAARGACSHEPDPPKNFDDFISMVHGAVYMGAPEQRHHFDFLTKNGRTEPISSFKTSYPENISDQFRYLVRRFSELNMDVALVDLTTDELREAGLWVVRAVIPALVPLSFSYRARYLGHPRIYEYAQRMGLNVKSDADINPLPQPFA